jgi:hypothetical protein
MTIDPQPFFGGIFDVACGGVLHSIDSGGLVPRYTLHVFVCPDIKRRSREHQLRAALEWEVTIAIEEASRPRSAATALVASRRAPTSAMEGRLDRSDRGRSPRTSRAPVERRHRRGPDEARSASPPQLAPSGCVALRPICTRAHRDRGGGARRGNALVVDRLEHVHRPVQIAVSHSIHRDKRQPCYLATAPPGEPRRDRLPLLALRRRRPILTWFHRVSWPFESRWGRFPMWIRSFPERSVMRGEPGRRSCRFSQALYMLRRVRQD